MPSGFTFFPSVGKNRLAPSADPNPVSTAEPLPHRATVGPADPDEVDISRPDPGAHAPTELQASAEDEVRRLLRGPTSNNAPYPDGDGSLFGAEVGHDPIPRILQQLVGGPMPIDERRRGQEGSEQQTGLSHSLADMLKAVGAIGSEQGVGYEEKQSNNKFGRVWRMTHVLFALALGVYMVHMTAFNGAQFPQPANGKVTEPGGRTRFFWAFATTQLILQSTRYFLERDRGPMKTEGWMSMIAGAFPEPWRGWALLLGRYSLIWSTVVQDAMVVIFVLGCVSWWEGAFA